MRFKFREVNPTLPVLKQYACCLSIFNHIVNGKTMHWIKNNEEIIETAADALIGEKKSCEELFNG